MPYLVLALGLLIGMFALFRFFVNAKPEQIRDFIRASVVILYCGLLLFFAITGRIIISIALLVLAIPFVISYFRNKINKRDNNDNDE